MSKNFLEDLKKAVDDGNFNSDAAKKINEIDKQANKFKKEKSSDELKKSIDDRVEQSGTKTVSEEEVAELNTEYEEKMQQRAKEEKIYATIATLENLDYEIEKNKEDLFLFIQQQKRNFDPNDESAKTLHEKLNELIEKYNLKIE